MKEKIKTTSFWLGIGGAIVILVECVASVFGFNVAPELVEKIIVSVCSVLVLLGVITKKTVNDKAESTQEELLSEIKDKEFNSDEEKE